MIKIVLIVLCAIIIICLAVAFIITAKNEKKDKPEVKEKTDLTKDKAYRHLLKELKGRNDIH